MILVGMTLAIAAVPASASAAVRTGSVQDPQGDTSAIAGPVLDIKSVVVRYDDAAGTLRVTWTYYNDVRAQYDYLNWPRGHFSASRSDLGPSDYASVEWMLASSGPLELRTSLLVSGSSGSLQGTGTMSEDGRVVTAEFSTPALVARDFQRGNGMFTDGDGVDEFWFDGYSAPVRPPAPGATAPQGPGTTPPSGAAPGTQGMTINDGAQYTNDPNVTLSVLAPPGASWLRVSNDGGFRAAKTFAVSNTIRWHLAESGPERLPKTVYLRFGNDAQTFADDIILDQTMPTVSSATVDASRTATKAAVAQAAAAETPTYRVRIRAKDATSGVAKVQFAHNKQHPSSLRKFARTTRYKATRAPKYLRVQDRAGNFSRWRSVR
jgi:hypothetical protein